MDKGVDTTFRWYLELMVQYGFVTLFAAAFPLAPLIAVIQNFVLIHANKFKLLDLVRRPLPSGAKNIGTWFYVLQITSNIALITNFGIVCFTIPTFNEDQISKQ